MKKLEKLAGYFFTATVLAGLCGINLRCIQGTYPGFTDRIDYGNPPQITSQPLDQVVTAPNPATFSVTASGDSPMYTWKVNGNWVATKSTGSYTTPPTTLANNGDTYTVTVSNGHGSVESRPAILTVNQHGPIVASGRVLDRRPNEVALRTACSHARRIINLPANKKQPPRRLAGV